MEYILTNINCQASNTHTSNVTSTTNKLSHHHTNHHIIITRPHTERLREGKNAKSENNRTWQPHQAEISQHRESIIATQHVHNVVNNGSHHTTWLHTLSHTQTHTHTESHIDTQIVRSHNFWHTSRTKQHAYLATVGWTGHKGRC